MDVHTPRDHQQTGNHRVIDNMSPIAYEQVQGSRLYERVAAHLQQHVIDGQLPPGEKLPSEHSLAQEFGVSRTVIREAIQNLQTRGLVTVVHGSGTFVSEPATDTISEAISTLFQCKGASLYDLHEVREVIEVQIATLAAERATDGDKAELRDCLRTMEPMQGAPREYIELDLLFHGILARATGNEVFLLLLEPLIDLLRRSRLEGIQMPGGVERSLRGHKAIYEAVRDGSGEAAGSAMREHLREVSERLEAAGETQLF